MEKKQFSVVPSVVWQQNMAKLFKKVIVGRYGCLDHFAITLILPDHHCVNICTNPDYILSYHKMDMQHLSAGLFPELIDSLPVVPWRLLVHENDGVRLQKYIEFKEVLHGLYSGMSFVHRIGDCHLNVATASKGKDPRNAITFLNNAEDILNLGAFVYDNFRTKFSELVPYELPKIEQVILNDEKYRKIDKMTRDWRDKGIFIR